MKNVGKIWLGFAVLVTLVVTIVMLAYHNTYKLNESAGWVTHTQQVIRQLNRVVTLAKDAEIGERGYLITEEDAYLQPYRTAITQLNQAVNEAEQLTIDNPQQQAGFPEVRKRVNDLLAALDKAIAIQRAEGTAAARRFVMTDTAKNAMDALRADIAEMVSREDALLKTRAEESKQNYRIAVMTEIVAGILAISGFAAFILLLRSHLIERASATAEIAEQRERLRTTLASIGDAVIATDMDGNVTLMNAVAEALTGWNINDATGKPLSTVFNIINESTRQPVESPAKRALREGVIVGLANHTLLISRDGQMTPIDDSAAPIRCKDGEIVGCVLVFRDITERKESDEQLRQLASDLSESDRRKGEFLAVLAHELRNPLAPIRNALQIIRTSRTSPDQMHSANAMMERQVNHMVRLVDDLLDVSRIGQGKIELRLERIDLRSALDVAIEATRPAFDHGGHKLTLALSDEPIYLNADPVRIAQIFTNLLNNAGKYSEHGHGIKLSVAREGNQAVVRIKDSGFGITKEMLPRIFDMFTQVDHSMEKSGGGLGIGLTLVRRLIEMHGGSVTATSEGLGKGSEFTVRLPIAADTLEPTAKDVDQEPTPVESVSRRVLVVDDNIDAANSLAQLLDFGGHVTKIANDGIEAVGAAETFAPEIVLLDIGLPGLNGYEAAKRIRKLPRGQQITIIALTGWGQAEDREKSKAAGFDTHIVKPVDYDKLEKLLANLTRPG